MVEVGYYVTCSIFDYRRYNSSMEPWNLRHQDLRRTRDSWLFTLDLIYYRRRKRAAHLGTVRCYGGIENTGRCV